MDYLKVDQEEENSNRDVQSSTNHGMHSFMNQDFEGNEDELKRIRDLENSWFEESQEYFQTLSWWKRPSKRILFTILSIHTLSFTVVMGPLVILMLNSICSVPSNEPTNSNSTEMSMGTNMISNLLRRMDMGGGTPAADSSCKNKDSQKIISNIQSILSILSGVLGFLLSGKFGQLSDKYGRVWVFKIFSIINLIYTILLIVYFDVYGSYNETWMILILSISFLTGGAMTLIANGNSYLNDITLAKDRTVAISIFMSCIYTVIGAGSLISSFTIKIANENTNSVLYASLLFSILSTVLIFTILPESRHPEAMSLAKERYAKKETEHCGFSTSNFGDKLYGYINSLVGFFRPIKRLWLPRTEFGSIIPRMNVISLVFIDVFSMAATFGTMHVLILYAVLKYKWTGVEIGYYMSISGFGRSFVLLFIAPVVVKLLESRDYFKVYTASVDKLDKFTLNISLLFVFLSCLCLLFVNNSTGVYLSVILQSLSGMISPTIQSTVAKYSNKIESGEMFGAMALVRHIAMLILPVFFLQVYSHTVDVYPELFLYIPFTGSIITLLVSLLCLKVYVTDIDQV